MHEYELLFPRWIVFDTNTLGILLRFFVDVVIHNTN
jgi:hypothetical protein